MIRRRLIEATVSNSLGKVTTVAIWFLLTPFVLRRLGADGYALWVLTGAIASYGFLLDFGIGAAVVKYVAEHTARGERAAAAATIGSAAWLYAALALAALALSAAIAPFLPGLLGIGASEHATATRLTLLAGVNVAITLVFTPSFSTLRGLQRYDLLNAVRMANGCVEALAVVAALVSGWGVLGMMAVMVPVNALTGLAGMLAVRRVAPDLSVRWRSGSRLVVRRIASFSASTFTIELAGRLQTKTDEFVVAIALALSAVTPYALARKLGELSQTVTVQFLKAVMPLASALDAGGDRRQLRHLYIVSSRVALAVLVPITLTLVVLGSTILSLWVGPEYAQYSPLLAVLAVATLISTSQWPAVEVLQGISRHRFIAVTSLAAGGANIALSLALLPALGLMGVALGTLIPAIVASLFIVRRFASRTLQVSWRESVRDIWAPGLLPAAGAAVVLVTFHRQAAAPAAVSTLVCAAAAALVYAAGYLSMPACAAERTLLRDFASGSARRLGLPRPRVSSV